MRLDTQSSETLVVKEGIVLDADGNELALPQDARFNKQGQYKSASNTRVYTWSAGNWFSGLLLLPLVVIVLTVGITLFASLIAFVFVSWVIYRALKALFSPYS